MDSSEDSQRGISESLAVLHFSLLSNEYLGLFAFMLSEDEWIGSTNVDDAPASS